MQNEESVKVHQDVLDGYDVVSLADLRTVFLQVVASSFNRVLMNRKIAFRAEVKQIRSATYSGGVQYGTLQDGEVLISAVLTPDLVRILNVGDAGVFKGVFQIKTNGDQAARFDSLVFRVSEFVHEGLGVTYENKLKLKRKLESEGLLSRPKQRFPQVDESGLRIVIVSNQRAKGYNDIISALGQSRYVQTYLQQCNLANERSICEAVESADKRQYDVVIVARGGGDGLGVFDSEQVVRTIAGCSTYTMTAIGHADDSTIANEVADYAVISPTAAATFIIDRIKDFEFQIERRDRELQRQKERKENQAQIQRLLQGHKKEIEEISKVKDDQIKQLSKQIEKLNEQQTTWLKTMEKKDKELETLQKTLDEAKKVNPTEQTQAIQNMTKQLGEMHASQQQLQQQLKAMQDANMKLQKQLSDAVAEKTILERKIAQGTRDPVGREASTPSQFDGGSPHQRKSGSGSILKTAGVIVVGVVVLILIVGSLVSH